MPEIKYDPSEIELIKARYQSGNGPYGPAQMYASMLIVLAELERVEAKLRERVPTAEAGGIVALTMTPDAGRAFFASLMHAAARLPQAKTKRADDEMDHVDWLQWAASRLDTAIRAAAEPDGFPEEFLNARVRFWQCPVDHPDRNDDKGFPVQSVEWRGDVAHCLEPGCGKTSAAPTEGDQL